MSSFKLPISFIEQKIKLNENIITDLELIKTIDTSPENTVQPIYNYAFNPETIFGKQILQEIPNYYTTDTHFLKDTQQLLKTYNPNSISTSTPNFDNISNMWNEIKLDTGFIEKYQYIDIPYWKYLNNSEHFLQIMSIYNLSSPLLSLFIPVILLIIPFFIIKLKGLNITCSEYIETLKVIAANHAIGNLFTNFHKVENQQKVYLLISTGFYLFSIYQNIMTCFKFHTNMIKIHSYLDTIKNYIEYTTTSMKNLLSFTSNLTTYSAFNQTVQTNIDQLNEFHLQLQIITPYNLSPYTVGGLGHVLKCFYQLYDNQIYNTCFTYSFGFNGFIENIEGFIHNIKEKFINLATFTKKQKKNKFKNSYYPVLMNNNPIKNSCKLNNMIITGPNASGKTTTLKSLLINVIITQQFGYGFYDKATLNPYDFIHCYLNIPDTSGRDSLFQAECRRCKEILDTIKENKSASHFCVFDELYSGTNPEEAVMSSYAFMDFLIKKPNISSILTTHFIEVCNKLDKNKHITNFHMSTDKIKDDFKYNYLLKKGISFVKGGIKVLKDMNYPDEIIHSYSFSETI